MITQETLSGQDEKGRNCGLLHYFPKIYLEILK